MKKNVLKSHLHPYQKTSFKDDWKILSKGLDLIFEGRCDQESLEKLTSIVYRQCNSKNSNDIITKIQDKFDNYFKEYLTSKLAVYDKESPYVDELAKEYISKTGVIMPRFEEVMEAISSIICYIQHIRGNYDFHELFKSKFIKMLDDCNCYDYIFFSISKLFDEFLNQYQIDDFFQESLFKSVYSTKNLILCASPEKLRVIKDLLIQQSEVYFSSFVYNSYQQLIPPPSLNENSDEENEINYNSIFTGTSHKIADSKEIFDPLQHIIGYCDECHRLAELEYQMTEKLFDRYLANDVKNEALYRISDPDTDTMKFCLSQTHLFLKDHQIENFEKLFNIVKYNVNCTEILSQKICDQILKEPNSIDKLPEIIKYYNKIDNFFSKRKEFSKLSNSINKSLSKLVNSDQKGIMKGLLKTINMAASTDSDIQSILPVISFFDKKTEFELMHLRHVARRLTQNGINQIDNEVEILNQLEDVKPQLQLESLRVLINDAAKSLQDGRYGPVLLVNATSWPYKPPYPSPVALSSISTKISQKYAENNPNRELHFPINHWMVNVKDTLTGTIYNGTGVQAEILLYFNNHKVITDTALEPRISQPFLSAALKAMSNKSIPALIVNNNAYSLNENWKHDNIVKLRPPDYKDEIQTPKNADKSKGDMIKACAVQKMKTAKILKFSELDEYIKNELASKVPVSTDDVKKYIDLLIETGYLEEMGHGRLAYIS
ncbi:ubiquitin ligase (cullin) of SCF [Tritrichomonas musculus]|uniref:Ubiquitin ligase (Cullin) of SCF n=1 Tax=Tritrichomonas musculus TaxID=1915356 RepID=A0ABR2IXX3_9EUKA